MSKSYTEELALWLIKRDKKKLRQDGTVVAFLAIKSDIQAAISAGYSLTTIWEHLYETGKFKFTYETFRKHVKRHIKKLRPPAISTLSTAPTPEPVSRNFEARPSTSKELKPSAVSTGFTFNAVPKKEDLI